MISLHSVLNVIVISISVIHIRAQIDEKFHYSTNNGGKFDGNTYVQFSEPPDEVPDYNVNEIPLDLMMQISSISNVSEFIDRFVDKKTIDPRDGILNGDVDVLQRSIGRRPVPAVCIPSDTIVRLQPDEPHASNVIYIPSCTRVKRCGGCCNHAQLACQPIETEQITFEVIKEKYVGGGKFVHENKALVVVEQHKRCRCSCRKKASDCNSFQKYIESQCLCSCTNYEDREKCLGTIDRIWDPENCLCRCKQVHECTTGTFYDENICGCSPIDY